MATPAGSGRTLSWMLISGLSVGWLSGLSTSPVIASVLSSLLAAIAGAIAGLKILRKENEEARMDAPIAAVGALLIGVAIAAPIGVVVRANCLLTGGQCPTPASSGQPAGSASMAGVGVGLFSSQQQKANWCNQVQRARDNDIGNTMKLASDQAAWISEIVDSVQTPESLRRIAEAICEHS